MYEDSEYADTRLQETIVRTTKGVPVRIDHVIDGSGASMSISCAPLGTSKYTVMRQDELDLKPVPLGWCNIKNGGLAYLARRPMRHDWRQGLRRANHHSLYGEDHREVEDKDLANTILSLYPNFSTAYNMVKNGKHESMAFCREFAVREIDGSIVLLYKWYGRVGDIVNGSVTLDDKWVHLNNMVEEAVG